VALPKGVRAVLFDFDQTLIHLGADWERLRLKVKAIAEKYGVGFDETWVLRGIGLAFRQLTDAGREHDAAAFRAEAFRVVEEEEDSALANSHAIGRSIEVVNELRARGYRMAIVSNNNPASINKGLLMFGFPAFEFVIGRHNGEPVKPSPIPVHNALAKLSVKPGDAVIVGDGESDVAAGKAAGVATVLFAPPGSHKEIKTKPTETIDDIVKLLALLPSLNGSAGHSGRPAQAAT
jgi:HAD superfamily hydrolase (TIGR01549 family)